jgi:hypothetical protein
MEPEKTPKKSRFKIEVLEERIAPAHLGTKEIFLPHAASNSAQGIENANNTPTHETPNGAEVPHHLKKIIILSD